MKNRVALFMTVVLILGQMLCCNNTLSAASENGKGNEKKADQGNQENGQNNPDSNTTAPIPTTTPVNSLDSSGAVNIEGGGSKNPPNCYGMCFSIEGGTLVSSDISLLSLSSTCIWPHPACDENAVLSGFAKEIAKGIAQNKAESKYK